MPLSEFTQRLVEKKLAKYCSGRIPEHSRHQVKLTYKIRGNSVTLIEERPYFRDPSTWTQSPVAQFRFDGQTKKWSLYCSDRNGKWHLYGRMKPSSDFDDLLREVDRDTTGIFWG
jgi:hypothetical protein